MTARERAAEALTEGWFDLPGDRLVDRLSSVVLIDLLVERGALVQSWESKSTYHRPVGRPL